MSQNILSSQQIKNNIKSKIIQIKNKLFNLFNIVEINNENTSESFGRIYDNLINIEDEIIKLENSLEISNINNIQDIDERNRIIDQKILKLFTPYILYYKMCLLQNNN